MNRIKEKIYMKINKNPIRNFSGFVVSYGRRWPKVVFEVFTNNCRTDMDTSMRRNAKNSNTYKMNRSTYENIRYSTKY